MRPREKEMQELNTQIEEESERKRKWLEMIKFSATIDLATGKVEHKVSVVPPVPEEEEEEGGEGSKRGKKGKGKGKKGDKGSKREAK